MAFFVSYAASAAEFDIIHPPGTQFAFVIMKERIVEGDADKFEAVIGSIGKVTVMLSGPGGLGHRSATNRRCYPIAFICIDGFT